MIFICPKRLHDFFVTKGCMIFGSQEDVCFFGPERLRDFVFVRRGCVIYYGRKRLCDFVFVLRGCMICYGRKRFHDFVCPEKL